MSHGVSRTLVHPCCAVRLCGGLVPRGSAWVVSVSAKVPIDGVSIPYCDLIGTLL